MVLRLALAAAAALLLGSVGGDGYPDWVPPALSEPPGYLLGGDDVDELGPADLAGRLGDRADALSYPVGEQLVYRVSYFGVPVGLAAIGIPRLVEHGDRVYVHMVATARTNDVFTKFYRVDDRTEAWVDLETGRIERTRTRLRHGSKETREEVRFDWPTHFVHVRRVKVHKSRLRELAFDFGPHVFDVFDAFYALRRIPLERETEVVIPVYASRKIHGFRVRVVDAHEVTAPVLGSIRAWELAPLDTIDGAPVDAGHGRVYVGGDGNVPFRVEGWFRFAAKIRIGGVRAELVERTAPDPAWPPWRPAPWTQPPLAPGSVEGRPVWDPPTDVVAARARTGVEAHESKSRITAVSAGE